MNIQLKVNYNSKLTVEMFDFNGRLEKQERNNVVKIGLNTYKLSIRRIESDTYLIILKTDKEKLIKKVIFKK